LKKKGVQVSQKRIARLMKEEGIVGCYNESKKPKTTDSKIGIESVKICSGNVIFQQHHAKWLLLTALMSGAIKAGDIWPQ